MNKDLNVETHGLFRCHYDVLTEEECQILHKEVRSEEIGEASLPLLKRIVDLGKAYNDDLLNFNVDLSMPEARTFDGWEGESKVSLVPDHGIHTGNITKDNVVKFVAVINISNRDDVQGGELIFKNWAPSTRVDNFGAVISSEAGNQPNWTNEQGTVIFFPAVEQMGFNLITSGPYKRLKVLFKGPAYV